MSAWLVLGGGAACIAASRYFGSHPSGWAHTVETMINWLPWLIIAVLDLYGG